MYVFCHKFKPRCLFKEYSDMYHIQIINFEKNELKISCVTDLE
jgi:hypothetical protein